MPSYQYIDTQEALEKCCLQLQKYSLLSVDTEFVRERTYYSQPGLIQVSDGNNISLIDPNSAIDLTSFFKLMESPDIRIVMHSAGEDIELFYTMGCDTIRNLFDTQIAASWLGLGQSLSLQNLVEHYEQVTIAKQLSRTNWLKRPLTEAQLEYAAIDVLYLNSICIQQEKLLSENGFLDHMLEDCHMRCEQKAIDANDQYAYLKVKTAIKATDDALGRLQLLSSWRERQARADDKPRQHIIQDRQLVSICIENPTSPGQLSAQCGLPPFIIRRYGKQLLELLQLYSVNNAEVNLDHKVLSLRDIPGAGKTLDACRKLMKEIHQKHNIPSEVLPSKRWLEQFLLHLAADWYPAPDGWEGWRVILLEEPLLNCIKINRFNQT